VAGGDEPSTQHLGKALHALLLEVLVIAEQQIFTIHPTNDYGLTPSTISDIGRRTYPSD